MQIQRDITEGSTFSVAAVCTADREKTPDLVDRCDAMRGCQHRSRDAVVVTPNNYLHHAFVVFPGRMIPCSSASHRSFLIWSEGVGILW